MTNIRTVASAMATAASESALASRRALLSRQIGETQELITELGGTGVGSETASTLEEYVENVDAMTGDLARTVEERLRLSGLLSDRIQLLADRHLEFNLAIEPLISRELALLGAESERVATHTTESLSRLNDISFKGLIPILSTNVELARMQESLAAASTAGSEAMLDTYWGEFVRSSSMISRNIDEIKSNASAAGVIDSAALTEHFDRIMRLSVGDGGIFETVRTKLADGANLRARIESHVSELEESFVAFEFQVRLSITLIRGQTVNVGVDLNRQVSESLAAIREASVDGYGMLLELEALGNRAIGLLSVAAFAEDQEALGLLRRQFEASENEAASALARLQTGTDLSETTDLVGRLVDFGEGEAGIFSLRENELRTLEKVEDLLFRTNALTLRMSTIAAEIVTDARAMSDSAAARVLTSLDSSRLTLLSVIGVSLLAMAGAVVYVTRPG